MEVDKMRCVAYCRVSTDHEEQKTSIEAQKKHYSDLFKTEGYQPAEVGMLYRKDGTSLKLKDGIFADEGISGTSLLRREAFNTMIEQAKKGVFSVIYIKSVSRFSRNVEDGVKIWKDLREAKVRVIFEDNPSLNNLDVESDTIFTIYISLAQQESVTKSNNVKWGLRKFHEQGKYSGNAPYGYDVVNAWLVKNPEEEKVVKEIYSLFLNEGYGLGKLARHLNNNSIPTKTGVKWSQTQVNRILSNEIYRGIQRSHITETVDITRKTKNQVDKDEHIVTIREELRIIDEETYNSVQRERAKRSEMFTNHSHHSNTNLLSTLIYCGHCGGVYKRKKRHTYRRIDGESIDIGYEWTCGINDMYGKNRCGHRNMLIEDDIMKDMKEHINKLKTNNMKGYFELYLLVKFNHNSSSEELEELKNQKDKNRRKRAKVLEDYTEGIEDESSYKAIVKELNIERREIESAITRIEQYDLEMENAKAKYQEYLKYVQEVDIDNLTNTIIKRLFRNIVVKGIKSANGKKHKMIMYNYNFMDMSLEELLDKVEEKGYRFSEPKVEVSL